MTGRSNGRMAWAAAPANSAGASVPDEVPRVTTVAERRACSPKRAIMSGWRGERQRRQHVVDEAETAVDDRRHQLGPRLAVGAEAGAGRLDRPLQQDGVVVERMGERDGRVDPTQPVAIEGQRAQRRRSDAERVDRRTDVVDEAGFGELGAAGPPPAVGWPSTTSTRRPARAIVIAATSPLGPDPMTTASYSLIAFPGHATMPASVWPLLGWRLVARTRSGPFDVDSRQPGERGLGLLDELDR